MVKEIMKDLLFLSQKAETATKDDIAIAQDLLDTLAAHRERCVGMAANMIGVRKRVIAFFDGGKITVMFDPEIISKAQPYDTREGCLSLIGDPRPVTRYRNIKVRYKDKYMKSHEKRYSGVTAQIIQHEVDHCSGVLI